MDIYNLNGKVKVVYPLTSGMSVAQVIVPERYGVPLRDHFVDELFVSEA